MELGDGHRFVDVLELDYHVRIGTVWIGTVRIGTVRIGSEHGTEVSEKVGADAGSCITSAVISVVE
jgi:hypothetical protein